MTTHLVAFQQSVDQVAPAAINNVVDDILTRNSATRYQVPADYGFIHWGAALGINLTRAYIEAPSLQVRRMRPEIVPHSRGTEAFTPQAEELWIPNFPIALTATEDLEVWASEDGAGATQMDAFLALGPGQLDPIPDGDIRIVRLTGTTTLVARAWSTCTLTPELALEPGAYALVDFLPISVGILAARALFTGQVFRPGMPGIAGAEGVAREFDPTPLMLVGGYDMGHFTHNTIPQFQFFSISADTVEVVLARVVKIA